MSFRKTASYIVAGIIIVLFWILVGVVAYKRLSTAPVATAYCNDYACTNFREGTNWAIRNCQGTDTTEGTTYVCDQKGLTGSCGSSSYCCPGPGMLWTSDMTECTPQMLQNSECCACPGPTPPTITSQCNGPCMSNANCTNGNVCVFDQGFGWVCRNPACYSNAACNCSSVTPTTTQTPTPTTARELYSCSEFCITSSECQSDLRCVSVNNTRQCRNPDCSEKDTCLCIN